jgi:chemotaxis protein CheD
LGIGEAVVVDSSTIVRTVLGSCVAIILHVPRLKLSAVCHAQMPEPHDGVGCGEGCPHPCKAKVHDANALRFVSCSLRYMLGELSRRSVNKKEIICTLVGGANVVRNIDRRWSVADRNVKVATKLLKREGIPIRYSDVGGTKGRVIEHICDLNQTGVRYH